MAVAFANNWDIILSKLESLFRTEFKGALKVYSGLQNEMEGNQYLRLSPISSSLVDYSTTLETREFVIGMALYFNEPNIKKAGIDNVMRLVSRIETIIANNNSITLPDNSVAYDCKIESSEIEASDSEYLVQFNFKCTHANSIAFPTIAITAAEVLDGGSSEDSTLSLTFKTSHITTNFVTGDVTVVGGSLGSISGSGKTYTATFTPSGTGAKTIQVVAGKFTDYSGNKNIASDVFNWTYTERFISTWTTEGEDERITIPFVNDSNTINFTIDWGDPNDTDDDTVTAWNQDLDGAGTGIAHTYEDAGTYTIRMSGTISGLKFNNGGDKLKIQTITNWGTLNISTNKAFYGCSNLNITANNAPTISTTDLADCFVECNDLTSIGAVWDVSSVQIFNFMFYRCTVFNQDISSMDVSSATSMLWMFKDARAFNQPIGSWNVSNVTNIGDIFFGATNFNGDISGWDTGAVQHMTSAFNGAANFNQDIGNWDTSNVTSFARLFYGAGKFNQDISDWDTSSVTDMQYAFFQAADFNQDLPTDGVKWNVSNVLNFQLMFYGASDFNGNISSWDVSSATTINSMFHTATSFTQNIGGWNLASVNNMYGTFQGASSFNQNISSWDIAEVTTMENMFNGANALSDANYDALLIAWNGASHLDNVPFHAGDADPSADGITARVELVGDGWTIIDNDGTHT